MNNEKFNELYDVKALKVSYENFNEAYQIFYGVCLKNSDDIQRVFSTYIYIKDAQNQTNEEIIKLGYENIKDNILSAMSNTADFNNLLMKNINI